MIEDRVAPIRRATGSLQASTRPTRKALVVLAQSLAACALVFSGWGFKGLGNFFTEPVRTLLLLLLVTRNAVETLFLRPDAFIAGKKTTGYPGWMLAVSRLTMWFLCWFLPFADRRAILTFAHPGALRYLGVLMFLVGGAVQLVALRTLGRQYSVYVTVQSDHQLVDNGIYRLVRHPIYLGLVLTMLGTTLAFSSWLVIPVIVLVTIFVSLRIRQEEALLSSEFGLEFESYRQRTKMLLPHLY
jgi:protein-S-isoprenylcysteine O-methyltransferase Ste14